MSDLLEFAEDRELDGARMPPWKILVVDDDPSIHKVTQLALGDLHFCDRPLELISAHSGDEAVALMRAHPDIAVILMDVVMDSEDDGLRAVRQIREDLGNRLVRIILRTGQPGQAPEHTVIHDYDINDYKEKTELTAKKLYTSIYAALRGYQDLASMDRNRRGLEQVIEASASLMEERSVRRFAQGVLEQLGALYFSGDAVISRNSVFAETPRASSNSTILAGTGQFSGHAGEDAAPTLGVPAATRVAQARQAGKTTVFAADHFLHIFRAGSGNEIVLYLDAAADLGPDEQHVVELFCRNIGMILDKLEREPD